MKTIYTTIILLFVSISSFAQDEVELFGEWFLNHRTFGPTAIYPPLTAEEDYNIILNFRLLPPNAGNPFIIESYGPTTTTIEGRFEVENGIMEIFNVVETILNCEHPPIVCSYFDDYNTDILFDPDTLTETGEHIVTYEVTGTGDDAILTITNGSNGEQAVYGRQPAIYNDITGFWYVQSITTDGVQHDNYLGEFSINFTETTSEIGPYYSFFGGSPCNGYLGSYTLLSENTIAFLDWAALASCSNSDAFGRYYFKYSDILELSINPDEPISLDYEIIGTGLDRQLTITNSEGDSVVFGLEIPEESIFKTWYSYSTETADGIIYPSPVDNPTLEISPWDNGTIGMGIFGTGGCNDFEANHNIYSSNDNKFSIYEFIQTLVECDDNLYEPTYSAVLSDEVNAIFNYELQNAGETLVLTNTLGDVLTFGSEPLPSDIIGQWFLHYLDVESEQIYNPNPFSPGTINFSTTPSTAGFFLEGTAACNSFISDYYFNPQQTFNMEYLSPTLGICESMEEIDFENAYFNSVLINPQSDIAEFNQEITGTGNDATLVITNTFNGNRAIYGRHVLSVDDNTYMSSSLTLNKNPVNDLLLFSMNQDQYSSYEIYSISGKLISNGNLNANTIDVSQLESGLYFLKVSSDTNSSETLKFIKN